jgi:hypothetical protein
VGEGIEMLLDLVSPSWVRAYQVLDVAGKYQSLPVTPKVQISCDVRNPRKLEGLVVPQYVRPRKVISIGSSSFVSIITSSISFELGPLVIKNSVSNPAHLALYRYQNHMEV